MLNALHVEPWMLVIDDGGLHTVKHVDNQTDAKRIVGWLEESEHSIIQIKRKFYGLQSYSKSLGDEKTSFAYDVGNGVTLSVATAVFKSDAVPFVCTKDSVKIENHITGSGLQHQTWERHSKMRQVPGSYYEEDVE